MMNVPKRVAGGVVVTMVKKRKKEEQSQNHQRSMNAHHQIIETRSTGTKRTVAASASASLSSTTSHRRQSASSSSIIAQGGSAGVGTHENDENDDEEYDANDIPNDALMCLQAYTRPINAETCAYCPIFTNQLSFIESPSAAAGQRQQQQFLEYDDNDNYCGAGGTKRTVGTFVESSTHAVPMLPKLVLLHHLVNNAAISSSSSSSSSSAAVGVASMSSRAHAERAITQLASSNTIRLLQLHGTAITQTKSAKSSTTSSSWRGDGNDDDDIVIMETSVYVAAAQMALTTYFGQRHDDDDAGVERQHRQQSTSLRATKTSSTLMKTTDKEATIFHWFTNMLLPYFAGKTWFSTGALNSLFHNQHHFIADNDDDDDGGVDDNNGDDLQMMVKKKKRKYNSDSKDPMSGTSTTRGNNNSSTNHRQYYSLKQIEQVILHLVHAGLLLPRRRCGGGDDGYWFTLPGFGKAAKSIVDGRTNLLRRLQSTRYKEKKRLVLEQDMEERGRRMRTAVTVKEGSASDRKMVEQTGKFIVLDALSKGWIQVHESSTGEQFVRLSE